MTMALVGVLPVSGVNFALTLAPPVLQAEITQLGIDLSKLGIALAGKLQMGLNVPSLTGLASTLALFPPALASMLDPTKFITLGAALNVDLALQLGVIDIAVTLALSACAQLDAGFAVGGIAAWSYSGPASGLASLARSDITGAWQKGLMVATESISSWGQFSVSVNTGPSKTAVTGGPPRLDYLGKLNGGEVMVGLLDIKALLDLIKLKLQGMKVALELQLQLTVGVNLPDPSELIAIAEDLISQVTHLLDNLVNVNADITLEIGLIQVRLDYILSLVAGITAQLSAGGLAFWTYSGNGSLGADVAEAIANGVPGGSGPSNDIRAVILAHETPSVWAPFGTLLNAA